MSAHQSHTWRCPKRGLTGGVTNPLRHRQLINRHGKRARRLFWQRFYNAEAHLLPVPTIPAWACRGGLFGPKPKPLGPSSSRPKPNPKPTPVVDHGGTVRQ